ncbi:MAG: hydroxyacid dehydrogenase [Chloroflexi bacterium]|nr:hydroxyacid dehydrogenase [Chloroflexota bacterium]
MTLAPSAHVAFYEVEDWERAHYTSAFPTARLTFSAEPFALGVADDASVVSIFVHSQLTADRLGALPELRLIATRSTGFDHVDLNHCRGRGIQVANVPRYGENTVAEHTFALILGLSRNLHRAYVRTTRGDFSLEGLRGFDLKDKTLGVVGAGSIGLHVIRIAKGFGMRVLAFDARPQPLIAEVLGFEYGELDRVLHEADVVTLHVPYHPATHHLLDRDRLALMKRGAVLVNTARGAVVDTDALIEALDSGHLAGAGLDVFEGEDLIHEELQLIKTPGTEEKLRMLLRQQLLLRRENVIVTPHIAFNSREALQRIVDTTIENIRSFLDGRPQNLVGDSSR